MLKRNFWNKCWITLTSSYKANIIIHKFWWRNIHILRQQEGSKKGTTWWAIIWWQNIDCKLRKGGRIHKNTSVKKQSSKDSRYLYLNFQNVSVFNLIFSLVVPIIQLSTFLMFRFTLFNNFFQIHSRLFS